MYGASLRHGGILLLESLLEAGGGLEVLVNAAHDAGLFAVDERLGGEVIDAVVEAALDHLGVHLERDNVRSGSRWIEGRIELDSLPGWEEHTVINSLSCFRSIRAENSRCSDALSLHDVRRQSMIWEKKNPEEIEVLDRS